MLHFKIRINGRPIANVKIVNTGDHWPEREDLAIYRWSVEALETDDRQMVCGTCVHSPTDGALQLSKKVLELAHDSFHGRLNSHRR